MRKFNKAMAIKVLLISFIAWCIGTALFIFEVERIEYYTDYISKLLLLFFIYFNMALFAAIFSGIFYPYEI